MRRLRGLRSGVVQLIYLLAAGALGVLMPLVPVGFTVSADRAVEALVAVGIGIVTFIGVVYSLLFLVVQFGTTTFTPRLNLFRDSPIVWHAFGYFAGILVFSFTAAFSIGPDDHRVTGLVPVTLALLLVVALILFRRLQSAAFRSIQLASTLKQVTDRGRAVIDHLYPPVDDAPEPPGDAATGTETAVPWSGRWAVLQAIDVPPLVRRARSSDVVVEFLHHPGQTLTEGGSLAVVHGSPDPTVIPAVLAATATGHERTFEQDPLLALRVLADIALRALSPAVNDPATAVHALDALDSLLRTTVRRRLAVGRVHDAGGSLRVVVPMPDWSDFVAVSLDEVIPLSRNSVHVRHRTLRLLEDLITLAPPDRQPVLAERLTGLAD